MADEQDVFITGISGSLQQWSTEATATKIAGTLRQISTQNTSILSLLNAVKGGEQLSAKELAAIKAELRTNNRTESTSAKSESTARGQTQTYRQKFLGAVTGMAMSDKEVADQIVKNQKLHTIHTKKIENLLAAGMSRDEAEKAVDGENKKANWKKMSAVAATALASISAVKEATQVGFEQRFDMASELRQSGLMDGIGGMNEGFISIAKTISSTGFTFGMAAEMTKDFAKTVGIVGVKSTLDFVDSMARGPDGLMDKFALEFGQVVGISGEYLDSLRLSGQLRGRSDADLARGMESFMSNVQATSNVLKVSMEEAATILKNSLSDVEKGMLLTLPKAMQDSLRGAMSFAGGMNNPIGDLLAARMGAGSEAMFQQTQQFQQMSGNALGQQLIQFVNEAAGQFTQGGDAQFQSFMANNLPGVVQGYMEQYGQASSRSLAFANDGEILQILAQINPMAQNMADVAQGISGGTREDKAVVNFRDELVQALARGEGAMNSVMEGYITNLETLTESNRATSIVHADSIVANANLIDGANNTAIMMERAGNTFSRGVFHFGTILANFLPGNNENVDFMSIAGYTERVDGSLVADRGVYKSFAKDSSNLAESLYEQKDKGTLTKDFLQKASADYEMLAKQLLDTTKTEGYAPWHKDAETQNLALKATMESTMATLNALLQEFKQ
jgi:hypothetical protein